MTVIIAILNMPLNLPDFRIRWSEDPASCEEYAQLAGLFVHFLCSTNDYIVHYAHIIFASRKLLLVSLYYLHPCRR